MTKHFSLLWRKEGLTNRLSNLYLLLAVANFRVNHAHLAHYNIIHQPGILRKNIALEIQGSLKEFLRTEVLPKLEEMENELNEFYKTLK